MTWDKELTNKAGYNVRKTLQQVQEVLLNHGTPWTFEYTFPMTWKIIEPIMPISTENLQRMSVFFWKISNEHVQNIEEETKKSIEQIEYITANINSQNVQNLHTKIWFTIDHINPTQQEIEFLFSYFEKYKNFLEKNQYAWWEIGLEHNMTAVVNLKNKLEQLSEEKRQFDLYLKWLYRKDKNRDNQYKIYSDEEFSKYDKFARYTYDSHIQLNWMKLWFTKRVLARLKAFNFENYKKNAENIVSYKAWHSVSIYEHGVMINHEPFTIDSPFLRVTHEKMQAFLNNLDSSKDNIMIPKNASTPFIDFSSLVRWNLETYFKEGKFDDNHMKMVNTKKNLTPNSP